MAIWTMVLPTNMKPTAWLKIQDGTVKVFFHADLEANTPKEGSFSMTPLYTKQEIADFVKGLYFDDDFRLGNQKSMVAQIADKIEEEAKK